MQLTEREKALIRESYEKLLPYVAEASVEFYETLFDLAPSLRAMFREDIAGQGMRFMGAIGVIVGNLDQPEVLATRLAALGRAHAALGLVERDYRVMEEALFITLRETLGADFTPATQSAWRSAFRQIGEAMARAAGGG